MRKPEITYGAVQSLGRVNVQGEAASAASDYQTLGALARTTAGIVEKEATLENERLANEAGDRNIEITSKLARLTAQENINIDSPDIPNEVREAILSEIETSVGQTTDIVQDESGTFVPTYQVASKLEEYYRDEIQQNENQLAEGVGWRQRGDFYDSYAGAAIAQNLNTVANNINAANIVANQNFALKRADTLASTGTAGVIEAMALIKDSVARNVFKTEEAMPILEAYAQQGREMVIEETSMLKQQAGIAQAKGQEQLVDHYTKLYNDAMDEGYKFGFISKGEATKEGRAFNQSLQLQERRSALFASVQKGGIEAGQAYLDSQRYAPTDGDFTQEEYDKVVTTQLQKQLNQLRTNENRATDTTSKEVKLMLDGVMVNNMIANGLPAKSTDQRKAADSVWEAQSQLWMNEGADVWLEKSLRLADGLKYVPAGMKTLMQQFIDSDSPENILFAADTYGKLRELEGGLEQTLGDVKEIYKLETASTLSQFGATPDEIIAKLQTIDKTPPDILRQRQNAYQATATDLEKRSRKAVDELYPVGWFKSEPQAKARWLSQYRQIEEQFFIFNGGDIKQAAELAQKKMTDSNWGISYINNEDGELMEVAPNLAYFPEADQQFKEYVKTKWPDKDPNRFRVATNIHTLYPEDGKPKYAVEYQLDEDDPFSFAPVDAGEGYGGWQPDYKQTQAFAQEQKQLALEAQSEPFAQAEYKIVTETLNELNEESFQGIYGYGSNTEQVRRIRDKAHAEIMKDPMYSTAMESSGRTKQKASLSEDLLFHQNKRLEAVDRAVSDFQKQMDSKQRPVKTKPNSTGGRTGRSKPIL